MNAHNTTPWSRLAAAARRAPSAATSFEEVNFDAPAGFATRVVARAAVRPAGGIFGGLAFERLAARALGFACAGALAVTVWASLPATAEASPSADTAAMADSYLDPVGTLLEVVQS
jgi:hypothetical protein